MVRRAFAILPLPFLVACAATEPLPELGDVERDVCAPLGALICARAADCGCAAVTTAEAIDLDRCVARFRAECMASCGELVEAGLVADRRIARQYVAELEAHPSCDRIEIDWSRGLAFVDVEVGEPCPQSALCAGGKGACGSGVCRLLPVEAEPCTGRCAPGLWCDPDLEACRPLSGEGEPCQIVQSCAVGLRCVAGTCRAPAPDAGPCGETDDCGTGLVCDLAACEPATRADCTACASGEVCGRTAGRCRPRHREGEACREHRECADGLGCDGTTCIRRPGASEPCASELGDLACAAGLYCDERSSSCVARRSTESSCTVEMPCLETLVCNDGWCDAPSGYGESCDGGCAAPWICVSGLSCQAAFEGSRCEGDQECTGGEPLHCRSGLCRRDLGEGASCPAEGPEWWCEGACVRDETGSGTCVGATAGDGDLCDAEDDCEDDLYCATEAVCMAGVCLSL